MRIHNTKRGLLLPVVLAMTFLLVTCGGGDDRGIPSGNEADGLILPHQNVPAASTPVNSTSSDSIPEEDASSSSEAVLPPQAAPVAAGVSLGRFIHQDETRYPADRAPWLEVGEGQAAAFHLNSGNGLGVATGAGSVSGDNFVLQIETIEIDVPFTGLAKLELSFTILDENNLQFTGANYGLTREGDIFTLEGAPLVTSRVQVEEPISSEVSSPEPVVSSDVSGEPAVSSDASGDDGGVVSSEAESTPPKSAPAETQSGPGMVMMISVAAGSLVLGGVLATVVLTLLRKRKGGKDLPPQAGSEGGQKTPDTKEEEAARKRDEKAAKQAKASEKKAAGLKKKALKQAKALEKKAAGLEKKAAKQAKALEKKAEKANKAVNGARQAATAAAEKAQRAEQDLEEARLAAPETEAQAETAPPDAPDAAADAPNRDAPALEAVPQDGAGKVVVLPEEDTGPKTEETAPGGIFGRPPAE